MALTKPIDFKGLEVTPGYQKVVQINLNVLDKTGQITLNGYKSRQARLDDPNGNVIEQYSLTVTPDMYRDYLESAVNQLISDQYDLVKSEAEKEDSPIEALQGAQDQL